MASTSRNDGGTACCCQGMLRKLPKGTAECSDFGREDLRTQGLRGWHFEAFPKIFSDSLNACSHLCAGLFLFIPKITHPLFHSIPTFWTSFCLCYDLAKYIPCHSHVTDTFQARFFRGDECYNKKDDHREGPANQFDRPQPLRDSEP